LQLRVDLGWVRHVILTPGRSPGWRVRGGRRPFGVALKAGGGEGGRNGRSPPGRALHSPRDGNIPDGHHASKPCRNTYSGGGESVLEQEGEGDTGQGWDRVHSYPCPRTDQTDDKFAQRRGGKQTERGQQKWDTTAGARTHTRQSEHRERTRLCGEGQGGNKHITREGVWTEHCGGVEERDAGSVTQNREGV